MLIPTTLSVYLSIYPFTHVPVFFHSFSMFIPTRRSIYLSIYVSIHLSILCKKHVYSEHVFIWFYTEIFAKNKLFHFISGVLLNDAAETHPLKKFSQGRTSGTFLVSKKREPNAMMSCLMITELARVVFFVSGGAAAGVLQVRGAPGIMIPSRWKFTKQFHQTQLAVQLIVQASGCAVCCEAGNFFFMGIK